MEREKVVQTAGRDALGSFAPDFARYNEKEKKQWNLLREKL